jgi:hypothetical protein
MKIRPDEPPFCEHCGSLSEQMAVLLEQKEAALRDLERDLRNRRAQISRLQRERAAAAEASPLYSYAREAFDYWREHLMPKARELSGTRLAAVMARLSAAEDPEQGLATIKQAIDGVAKLPYVTNKGRSATGRASERQTELELICRSESHLLRFASYADEKPPQTVSQPELPTTTWVPQDRRQLVDALRGRVFLLEVEEDERRAQTLLDEIHAFSNGAVRL